MSPSKAIFAAALLVAATSTAFAAPRYPHGARYGYRAYGFVPYPYNPYSPSAGYRGTAPNDTRRSLDYQLDMGAGSGRY